MVTEVDIERLLQTAIADGWAETPIHWANTPPIVPGDASQKSLWDTDNPFIHVEVHFLGNPLMGLGTDCVRLTGYLTIDINVKEGTGSRQATNYRVLLNNLLQYKRFGAYLWVSGASQAGPYDIRQGWATYRMHWPFETR